MNNELKSKSKIYFKLAKKIVNSILHESLL